MTGLSIRFIWTFPEFPNSFEKGRDRHCHWRLSAVLQRALGSWWGSDALPHQERQSMGLPLVDLACLFVVAFENPRDRAADPKGREHSYGHDHRAVWVEAAQSCRMWRDKARKRWCRPRRCGLPCLPTWRNDLGSGDCIPRNVPPRYFQLYTLSDWSHGRDSKDASDIEHPCPCPCPCLHTQPRPQGPLTLLWVALYFSLVFHHSMHFTNMPFSLLK